MELVKTDKEKLFKREINSVSVSLSKLKILEENWDGSFYYIKAKVTINEKQTLELLAKAVINKGYEKELNKLKNILDKKGITISLLNETIKALKIKLDNSIPIVKIVTKTKAGFSVLGRTYGYYLGQEYRLNQIKKIYPELGNDTYMAHLEFKQKFGTSLNTIKKHLDDNGINLSMLNKEFKKFKPFSKDDSIKFINIVKLRAKGINVESPIIENLLMYKPIYDKYPEREFKDKYKKTFKSDGSGKAKGIPFEITVPQSWKSMEAKRPNIVRKFISQNGYGVDTTAMVMIKKLPLPQNTILTNAEIEEYLITDEIMKSTEKGMEVVDYGKFTIEAQPGYWQKINATIKRGTLSSNMYMLQYVLFYKNRMISIQFSAGMSIDGHVSKAVQIKQYEKFKPLFKQILNSFVLPDKYKDEEYSKNEKVEAKYYIYKLFNDKFQAVFPDSPIIQKIPKELLQPNNILKSIPYKYTKKLNQQQLDKIVEDTIREIKNSQPNIYADKINQVSYTSQTLSSGLKYNIGKYKKSIKQNIDEVIKQALKTDNRKLINFSSTLDRHKDTYIAIYHSSYFLNEQKIYSSTKHIYYKDKVYKWSISYINKDDKKIFDDYKHHVKTLK